MTSHPISSIFTELNADTLKTLSEKLTQKEFYETMPKVMNQEELDFLQASTSTTPTLVTESFMLRKLRGRREDGSEYPPEHLIALQRREPQSRHPRHLASIFPGNSIVILKTSLFTLAQPRNPTPSVHMSSMLLMRRYHMLTLVER
jgi:hypothetical protein